MHSVSGARSQQCYADECSFNVADFPIVDIVAMLTAGQSVVCCYC